MDSLATPLPATSLRPAPPAAVVTCERTGPAFQFRDVKGFEWTNIQLPTPNLPPGLEGLRILHLSDLHCRSFWMRAYDDLIARLQKSPPDIILFTGDFVDHKLDHRSALPTLQRLLPRLNSKLGTYAILGNHDVDLIRWYLPQTGIHLIDGGRAIIEHNRATIDLIGLPGIARTDMDPHWIERIGPRIEGSVRIILSHYPDQIRRVRPLQADLYLAGHTHGGQICLPGGFPPLTHDRLPRKFCKGVHRWDTTWLIVSRGFGFAGIPVRICCPAEVGLITLLPCILDDQIHREDAKTRRIR